MHRTLATLGAALLGGISLSAAAEVSGRVGLGSDYVWRGISQTGNQAALTGELEYAHDSGVYAGVWAGNVDFGPGDPSLEVDIYAGYARELASGLNYDVGVVHYEYPGANDLETQEYSLGLGYSNANLAWHYTDDYFGSDASAWYLELGADFSLPLAATLSLHIGRSDGEHFDLPGNTAYTDYRAGISREFAGVTVELAYTDTDLSDSECGDNICSARAVVTVSKSF